MNEQPSASCESRRIQFYLPSKNQNEIDYSMLKFVNARDPSETIELPVNVFQVKRSRVERLTSVLNYL